MQLANTYFERLLSSSDATTALSTLAQFWSTRADSTKAQLGLTGAEFDVHLYLWYSGEIGNGGHCQFLLNPVGAYAEETLQGLRHMGIADLIEILEEVCSLFANGRVPKDRSMREFTVRELSEAAGRRLEELDRRVSQQMTRCDQVALKYLREHRTEVLVSERSTQV